MCLLQLADVAKGLIYMHDQGVVHGDLKGVCIALSVACCACLRDPKANILIDDDGHALLADFNLITSIPDRSTFLSTCLSGGTFQWMSPELLDPQSFGLEKSRPTRESDCYALGMVIYEVLSGCVPFDTHNSFVVLHKILDGGHPERPQGEAGRWITDDIWDIVQLCWKPVPSERVGAKGVLLCLEGNSTTSTDPGRTSSFYPGFQ